MMDDQPLSVLVLCAPDLWPKCRGLEILESLHRRRQASVHHMGGWHFDASDEGVQTARHVLPVRLC